MFIFVTPTPGIPVQRRGVQSQAEGAQIQGVIGVREILQAIPMAAVAFTTSYELIAANDDCVALLRLPSSDIQGQSVRDFLPPPDRPSALQSARELSDAQWVDARPISALRRVISGDGQSLTCWTHVGMAVLDGDRCFVACIDLVNPVLYDAHRWRHRAEHDELTGLQRRGAILDLVAQWMDAGRVLLLAFLDIDSFKTINDTHGHAAGDHVLAALARRLQDHAPPGCRVGRLSGDEFVLVYSVAVAADVYGRHADRTIDGRAAAIDRLLAVGPLCVAEPIGWGEHLLTVSMSVGVTVSESGEDPRTLLSRADDAMYAQKFSATRGPR